MLGTQSLRHHFGLNSVDSVTKMVWPLAADMVYIQFRKHIQHGQGHLGHTHRQIQNGAHSRWHTKRIAIVY